MYRNIDAKEMKMHDSNLRAMGYSLIKSYISKSMASHLLDLLEGLHARYWSEKYISEMAAPHGLQKNIKNDQMVNNLMFFDRVFLELATSGGHLDIIRPFLNDPYYGMIPQDDNNFILAQLNARNGKIALPFHVDVRLQTPGEACFSMQTLLALNKIDQTSGALRVRPGSHLRPEMPNSNLEYVDAITLSTDPGDLVVFYSKLHHATERNDKNLPGWTILSTYRSWWLKPQFDIWGMVKDKYTNLSLQQKLIMGAFSEPSTNPFDSSSSRRGYSID